MTSQQTIKQTIKPLGNRVLAQRLQQEDTAKGGIILPDSAKKKQDIARVVAVGTGMKDKEGKVRPVPVQVGEKILLDKYAGQEVELDGETFLIVKSDDIIAIIN